MKCDFYSGCKMFTVFTETAFTSRPNSGQGRILSSGNRPTLTEGRAMIVREGQDIVSFGTIGEQREFERLYAPVRAEARRAARKFAAGFASLPSAVAIHRAGVKAYKEAGFARFEPGFLGEFDAAVRGSFVQAGPNVRCWWYQTGVDDARRKRKASVPAVFTAAQKRQYLAGYDSAK